MRFTSRWNWNLEMLVFMEGGKPENPEKNPRSKDENQQQTQPTYDTGTGSRTRATLVGGERSHHCAIPAPRKKRGGVRKEGGGGTPRPLPQSTLGSLRSLIYFGAFPPPLRSLFAGYIRRGAGTTIRRFCYFFSHYCE